MGLSERLSRNLDSEFKASLRLSMGSGFKLAIKACAMEFVSIGALDGIDVLWMKLSSIIGICSMGKGGDRNSEFLISFGIKLFWRKS